MAEGCGVNGGGGALFAELSGLSSALCSENPLAADCGEADSCMGSAHAEVAPAARQPRQKQDVRTRVFVFG